MFLAASAGVWILLKFSFFCSIDLKYLATFFGTQTAPQYTCELFLEGTADRQRFDAVFTNRIQYTTSIHDEVEQWVAANIDRWMQDGEDFFKIEIVPDEFLPEVILEQEGGQQRRRCSSAELIGSTLTHGFIGSPKQDNRIFPEQQPS